jgi:hypothetical protein
MLVVTRRDHRLVTLEALAKLVGTNCTALHQEVEGPIDGGHADPLPLTLQLAANAVNREVILGLKDDVSNEIPLAGEWLTMFPKVAMEALEKSRSLSLVQSCH